MNKTGKEDCQTQDRNHPHLLYAMWHIITESNNYYLTHLLKIGLDIHLKKSVTILVTRYSWNILKMLMLDFLVRNQERTGTSNREA